MKTTADDACSDGELLARYRDGERDAFATLYGRHRTRALRQARRLTRSAADAHDVVADAFAQILTAVDNGRGPTELFVPYLATCIRNTAARRGRDRTTSIDGSLFDARPTELDDPRERDRAVHAAFSELPSTWQYVLWQKEVAGVSNDELATSLGSNATAVSQLAVRARKALATGYLAQHVDPTGDARCTAARRHLPAMVTGTITRRSAARLDDHLAGCPHCATALGELDGLRASLRSIAGPAAGLSFAGGLGVSFIGAVGGIAASIGALVVAGGITVGVLQATSDSGPAGRSTARMAVGVAEVATIDALDVSVPPTGGRSDDPPAAPTDEPAPSTVPVGATETSGAPTATGSSLSTVPTPQSPSIDSATTETLATAGGSAPSMGATVEVEPVATTIVVGATPTATATATGDGLRRIRSGGGNGVDRSGDRPAGHPTGGDGRAHRRASHPADHRPVPGRDDDGPSAGRGGWPTRRW